MADLKGQSLSELITSVAEELRKVRTSAPPPGEAVMQFQECEIELNVAVGLEGGAGIRFWVIDVGSKGTREAGHTIKLKFSSIPGQEPLKAELPDRFD